VVNGELVNQKFITSAIGSLPHKNYDCALSFSRKLDIPVLFELPQLNPKHSLIGQLENLRISDHQKRLELYQDRINLMTIDKKSEDRLCIHLPGPDLLLMQYNDDPHAYQNSRSNLLQTAGELWAMIPNCLLCFDCPSIEFVNEDDLLEFFDGLRKKFPNINWGLHCCGRPALSTIKKIAPSFFSFDLYQFREELEQLDSFLKEFRKQSHFVFIGVYPTDKKNSYDEKLVISFLNRMLMTPHEIPIVLTPSCGLSGFTEEECDEVLSILEKVKRQMNRD
jgi:hypothetical protein